MTIEKLFPAGHKPETAEEIPAVFNNIIVSVNFLPGIRRRLHWRGLFRIPGEKECWTFKIKDFPGIFGMLHDSGSIRSGCISGKFNLYYFPAPDDPLLDLYSINAAFISQQGDYLSMVREFPDHPQMYHYCHIGHLTMGLSPEGKSLFLLIEGQSRLQIQSVDGIVVTINGTNRQLIAPGEMEQDIPSHELCLALLDTIASSITYLAGEIPCGFIKIVGDGFFTRYRSDGLSIMEKSSNTSSISLMITYGEESRCRAIIDNIIQDLGPESKITRWHQSDGLSQPPLESSNWWTSPDKFKAAQQGSLSGGSLSLPPLIIVTGFLGSGKTSFINNFIEYQMQKNRFTAVIQNELGKTGLDGSLLSDECAVVEMDEGCVCCSLSGNLRTGISTILEEFEPDYILLETTGVANPMNLLDELDEISDIARLDSISTLVDAENIFEQLESYSVAVDQIKTANIVIVNKIDLADDGTVVRIKDRIGEINPQALVMETRNGNINPFRLFDQGDPDEESPVYNDLDQQKSHTHYDDGISAYTLSFNSPLNREKFIQHIDTAPSGVFRIKGIVRFLDENKPFIVQYVGGRYTIETYSSSNTKDSFITIIGKNLDEKALTSHFSSLFHS